MSDKGKATLAAYGLSRGGPADISRRYAKSASVAEPSVVQYRDAFGRAFEAVPIPEYVPKPLGAAALAQQHIATLRASQGHEASSMLDCVPRPSDKERVATHRAGGSKSRKRRFVPWC